MQNTPIRKISFIEPSAPGNHVYTKWGLPRLGTIQLGTLLKNAGYEVSVYIEDIKGIDWADVFTSDLVGISTITSTAPRAYEMARQIRKAGIPVMMGGPHVSFMPKEALHSCDFVLRGEAEDSIVPLIEAISAGEGFDKIPGLSTIVGDKLVLNDLAPACKDLNSIPIPDMSLIRGNKKFSGDMSVTPIMTSRGCPFGCNFCSVTRMFGRKYRFRSTDSVIEELKKRNAEWIFFYDDNFAANRAHTKELLAKMIDEGISSKWMAQVRINVAEDEDLLDLMARANAKRFFIGFESINRKSLEALNKGHLPKDIEGSIQRIQDRGIQIHGMFIFGTEHDDATTIKETVRFAKRVGLSSVQFLILTPLPGTPVFEQMEAEGRLISRDWAYYDAHHVVFKPKSMSFLQLQKMTIWATLKFYSIPHILSCLNKFDIWSMLIRAYGWRISRNSRKNMKGFMAHLMEKYHEAGTSFDNKRQEIELCARKTTDDLKEFFKSFNFDAVKKFRSGHSK